MKRTSRKDRLRCYWERRWWTEPHMLILIGTDAAEEADLVSDVARLSPRPWSNPTGSPQRKLEDRPVIPGLAPGASKELPHARTEMTRCAEHHCPHTPSTSVFSVAAVVHIFLKVLRGRSFRRQFANRSDRLPRRLGGGGQRENLGSEIVGIAGRLKGLIRRFGVGMAEAHRSPV